MGVGRLWEVVAHRDSTVFHMEGSKCFIIEGTLLRKTVKGRKRALWVPYAQCIALVVSEKHLSEFTQRSQLRFFLKLILIIINYGFVIQSVTLLNLAVEQPLNSWQQSLKNTIFTLGWSSYCIIYDCSKMNLLRKMVIGAANRYNQLMTYMQIFKTLNNSPPHPPSPKHKSEPTMVSATPRNTQKMNTLERSSTLQSR